MQEKENIEQLFKDAFSNYEEPVRPELWTKISQSIQVPTPQITDPSTVVNSTVTTGSGIFGGATAWVAGAAIIVLSGLGIYYVATQNSGNQPAAEQNATQEKINDKNELVAPPDKNEDQILPSSSQPLISTPASTNNNSPESEKVLNSEEKVLQEKPAETQTSQANSENINNVSEHQESIEAYNPSHNQKPSESEAPKSTASGKTEAIISHLRANPASGIAPLIVDFSYNGEAQKTEWQFGDGQSSSQANMVQHTFEKPGNYTVTLKVYDDQGHVTLLNQNISVMENLHIRYIPNIFTPNNDGRNDIFTFDTPNIAEIEVSIYDQSGKFVYKWTGLDGGWDGKLNSGDPAPDGTYFYIIFATSESNQKHQQKGTITLKR